MYAQERTTPQGQKTFEVGTGVASTLETLESEALSEHNNTGKYKANIM